MTKPTVGSLFAGIGGFDLGFERAGFEVKWQVEIDPFCRRVLAKHWPDVRRHDDVKTFPPSDPEEWRVDCIIGGFPCQDISVAGRGAGIDGERSGLWSEYARIVRLLRPQFVVVENVPALLARGLGRVLGDLAESGFDAEWDCLPASVFSAPHERDRVFLVAYPSGISRERRVYAHGQDDFPRDEQWRAAQGVRSGRGWKRWLEQTTSVVDRFGAVAPIRRVDDGLSSGMDRPRIHGLGNAVVPQVAEWIGRRLIEAMLNRT